MASFSVGRHSARLALLIIAVGLVLELAQAQSAPTVSTASVDGSSLTLTFSSALATSSSAVASDFTVTHGDDEVSVTAAAVSGSTVTLTLQQAAPDSDCTDDSFAVDYSASASTLTGTNGGAVAAFSDQAVTNATDAAPAIVSIETDAIGRKVYVTFCEAIADLSYQWSDFSAFTLSVNSSTRQINDLLRCSNAPARLEIQLGSSQAISEGDTVTLAYDQSNGNDDYPLKDLDQGSKLVPSWAAQTVTNNVDGPPTLSSVSALYEVVTLTFSEALDDQSVPDSSAFTIGGVQHAPDVSQVAVSGSTVTLTLSGILHNRNSPTYTLSYSEPNSEPLRQQDGAHNVADISSYQFQSSTPNTKPQVTSAEVNGATLSITFDLPLHAVAPAAAFSIGGVDGISVSAAAFSGSTVTLTLSPAVSAGATITVSYTVPDSPPRIEGRNRRDADAFSNQAVTNRTVAPTPTLSSASVSADGGALTLTFSLALDPTTSGTPAASAFSLSGTSAAVTAVSVSGTTAALTLSPLADSGETITVSYTPSSVQTDPRLKSAAHSQAVAAFSNQAVTNNADGKPRPQSAAVDGAALTISFDRALDSSSTPAASAFAVGGVTATVSQLAVSGQQVTLTISPAVAHTDTVTISYTQPTSQPLKRDGSTLLADPFSNQLVTNETADPTPSFASAAVNASGRTLTIQMSGNLLDTPAGSPAISTFSLSGTTSASVTAVSVSGSTVTLSLAPAADISETVSLSYQPPADSTQPSLRSADGTWRTTAWSNQTVTNNADGAPRLLSAVGNGASLTLGFDRALDENAVPAAQAFSVNLSGVTVSAVAIDDDEVTLTLSTALQFGDTVTVSYEASGTTKLKRDGQAIDAPAFSNAAVANQTPQPLITSVIGNGPTITVHFSKNLDTSSTPATTSFSLGNSAPSPTSLTVSATTLTINLASALQEGNAYTLTYTAVEATPLSLDEGGTVPSFSKSITNNTDVAPQALTASADGSTLTLTFDQALDSTAALATSLFSLTASEPVTVTVVSYADHQLSLTLSRALVEEESASLTYTRPATGGIADSTGNRTASFTLAIANQTDTAPTPVQGTIEDSTITIILDQAIYADPRFEGPDGYPTEHFTLSKNDVTISFIYVSNGGPSGVGKIELTLSRYIAEGEELTIRYHPGTGTIRIREDDSGERRAEINNYELTNLNDDPPVPQSAEVDDTTLKVTLDQELATDSLPAATTFVLTPNDTTVESLSISEKELTLTLAKTAVEDEFYTLTYTPPTSDGLGDLTGNAAAAFTVSLTNNTDYAPYLTAAQTDTDGKKVYLTFDQRLDPAESIDHSWFSLTPAAGIDSVDIATGQGGTQLLITLDATSHIAEGSEVTLNYQPTAGQGLRDDDAGNLTKPFDQEERTLWTLRRSWTPCL